MQHIAFEGIVYTVYVLSVVFVRLDNQNIKFVKCYVLIYEIAAHVAVWTGILITVCWRVGQQTSRLGLLPSVLLHTSLT